MKGEKGRGGRTGGEDDDDGGGGGAHGGKADLLADDSLEEVGVGPGGLVQGRRLIPASRADHDEQEQATCSHLSPSRERERIKLPPGRRQSRATSRGRQFSS
eukprot:753596-Hanusia_phi.AAC.4